MNDFIDQAKPYAIGGVISLIIGWILLLPTLRSKTLAWTMSSRNIVKDFSSELEGLEIRYRGEEVNNVSTAKVAVWNDGKETIRRDDIIEANPPRLTALGDVRFLYAALIDHNNDESEFAIDVSPDDKSVAIGWYYLDPRHGAVIQIVHTGVSDEDLTLEGKTIGGKIVRKPFGVPPDTIPRPPLLERRIGKRRYILLVIVGNVFFVAVTMAQFHPLLDLEGWFLWVAVVWTILGVLLLVILLRYLLRSDVPEDLSFYDRRASQ